MSAARDWKRSSHITGSRPDTRGLPIPDPTRVVAIWETETGSRGYQPFTSPDYYDMLDNNSSFEEFGVYSFRWAG